MEQKEARIWDTTLYLRVSHEDGDKEESNSIAGQLALLRDYMASRPELREYAVRVDDGFSGSSFQRPAFQEMLEDIKAGRTNCVIVKDLSRFGRNYLEAGEYIEKIFPFLGVRFIAVNDGFDSVRERTGSDFLLLPFKNLINEAYCRDISIKIRTQLEIKRKRGEYLGAFAPYGYRKAEGNKNQLVVDEYAAGVVRDMFRWKLEGVSPRMIAQRLNESGIQSPLEYKKSQGIKYATSFKEKSQAQWSAASVIRLLKNPVYIGVLAQGKETTPSYKVHRRIFKEESQWVVVRDCHEAIIPKTDFENVQKVLSMDTRVCKGAAVVQPLSGLVFCGDCGASMVRKTVPSGGKRYVYYVCSRNRGDKTACAAHAIRDTVLEEIVLLSAQQQIRAAVDLQELLALVDTASLRTAAARKVRRQADRKEEELERVQKLRMSLYESLSDGILTREEYLRLKERYTEQTAQAEGQLLRLRDRLAEIQESGGTGQGWLDEAKRQQTIPVLDRETAVALVESVFVHAGRWVEVAFRWHDGCQGQPDAFRTEQARGVG